MCICTYVYMCICTHIIHTCCLPSWLMVRNLPASGGDMDLILWLVRTSGEGNGNPLQYSCLGNPLERGAWWVIWVGHDLVTKQHMYTAELFDCAWLFANPWIVACQTPLSMGFFRHEYWSGSPFLPPGIFLIQGSNPHFLCLLHWQADSLPLSHLWDIYVSIYLYTWDIYIYIYVYMCICCCCCCCC